MVAFFVTTMVFCSFLLFSSESNIQQLYEAIDQENVKNVQNLMDDVDLNGAHEPWNKKPLLYALEKAVKEKKGEASNLGSCIVWLATAAPIGEEELIAALQLVIDGVDKAQKNLFGQLLSEKDFGLYDYVKLGNKLFDDGVPFDIFKENILKIKSSDEQGNTLFHTVLLNEIPLTDLYKKKVAFVLDALPNVNAVNNTKETYLMLALKALNKTKDTVRRAWLLDIIKNLVARGADQSGALQLAHELKQSEVLDLFTATSENIFALIANVTMDNQQDRLQRLEKQLEMGAKPNMQDVVTGETPLYRVLGSVYDNKMYIPFVLLLLRYGADPSVKAKNGKTPFDVFRFYVKEDPKNINVQSVATYLSEYSNKSRDEIDIFEAIKKNDVKTVEAMLMQKPSLINAQTADKQSLLEIAGRGNISLVKMLFEKGLNVSQKSKNGEPLFFKLLSKEYIPFLLQKNIAWDLADDQGLTVAHIFSRNFSPEYLKMFASVVDFSQKTKKGQTPFMVFLEAFYLYLLSDVEEKQEAQARNEPYEKNIPLQKQILELFEFYSVEDRFVASVATSWKETLELLLQLWSLVQDNDDIQVRQHIKNYVENILRYADKKGFLIAHQEILQKVQPLGLNMSFLGDMVRMHNTITMLAQDCALIAVAIKV